MTATLIQDTQHGKLNLKPDGLFSYTPGPGFTGTDSFQYDASNGSWMSDPAQVNIDVTEHAAGGLLAGGVGFNGPGQAVSVGYGAIRAADGTDGRVPDNFSAGFHGPGLTDPGKYGAGFHGDGANGAGYFSPDAAAPSNPTFGGAQGHSLTSPGRGGGYGYGWGGWGYGGYGYGGWGWGLGWGWGGWGWGGWNGEYSGSYDDGHGTTSTWSESYTSDSSSWSWSYQNETNVHTSTTDGHSESHGDWGWEWGSDSSSWHSDGGSDGSFTENSDTSQSTANSHSHQHDYREWDWNESGNSHGRWDSSGWSGGSSGGGGGGSHTTLGEDGGSTATDGGVDNYNRVTTANHHYGGNGSSNGSWNYSHSDSGGNYSSSDGGDDGSTYNDWGTRKSGDGFANYTLGQTGTDNYSDVSSGGGSVTDGNSDGSNSQAHDAHGDSSSVSIETGPSVSFHGSSGGYDGGYGGGSGGGYGGGTASDTGTESFRHENDWTYHFTDHSGSGNTVTDNNSTGTSGSTHTDNGTDFNGTGEDGHVHYNVDLNGPGTYTGSEDFHVGIHYSDRFNDRSETNSSGGGGHNDGDTFSSHADSGSAGWSAGVQGKDTFSATPTSDGSTGWDQGTETYGDSQAADGSFSDWNWADQTAHDGTGANTSGATHGTGGSDSWSQGREVGHSYGVTQNDSSGTQTIDGSDRFTWGVGYGDSYGNTRDDSTDASGVNTKTTTHADHGGGEATYYDQGSETNSSTESDLAAGDTRTTGGSPTFTENNHSCETFTDRSTSINTGSWSGADDNSADSTHTDHGIYTSTFGEVGQISSGFALADAGLDTGVSTGSHFYQEFGRGSYTDEGDYTVGSVSGNTSNLNSLSHDDNSFASTSDHEQMTSSESSPTTSAFGSVTSDKYDVAHAYNLLQVTATEDGTGTYATENGSEISDDNTTSSYAPSGNYSDQAPTDSGAESEGMTFAGSESSTHTQSDVSNHSTDDNYGAFTGNDHKTFDEAIGNTTTHSEYGGETFGGLDVGGNSYSGSGAIIAHDRDVNTITNHSTSNLVLGGGGINGSNDTTLDETEIQSAFRQTHGGVTPVGGATDLTTLTAQNNGTFTDHGLSSTSFTGGVPTVSSSEVAPTNEFVSLSLGDSSSTYVKTSTDNTSNTSTESGPPGSPTGQVTTGGVTETTFGSLIPLLLVALLADGKAQTMAQSRPAPPPPLPPPAPIVYAKPIANLGPGDLVVVTKNSPVFDKAEEGDATIQDYQDSLVDLKFTLANKNPTTIAQLVDVLNSYRPGSFNRIFLVSHAGGQAKGPAAELQHGSTVQRLNWDSTIAPPNPQPNFPPELVAALKRALAPNGIFILSTCGYYYEQRLPGNNYPPQFKVYQGEFEKNLAGMAQAIGHPVYADATCSNPNARRGSVTHRGNPRIFKDPPERVGFGPDGKRIP